MVKYKAITRKTSILVNKSYEGESLEDKIEKMLTQNEPIEAESPQIYTERKDGVLAETNIRTDRWEIGRTAMDKVTRSKIAQREYYMNKKEGENNTEMGGGKASKTTEGDDAA